MEYLTNLYNSIWHGTPLPPSPQISSEASQSPPPHSSTVRETSISNQGSVPPDSILVTQQHLYTVFSGEEIDKKLAETERKETTKRPQQQPTKKSNKIYSKSLSQLEFEELKGFRDLGFVFSEEDKEDTDLISIVPGIQRLGRARTEDQEEQNSSSSSGSSNRSRSVDAIPRPYLSESWDVSDKSKPLTRWKIPVNKNEIEMRRNLRCWAHTVAESIQSV